MLTSTFRSFHEALFRPIREAAKVIAQDFVIEGMTSYLGRWGDNVYSAGTAIKDEKEAVKFAAVKQEDIEAFRRQAKLQRLYENVAIPS
jgi:hypothetical protein